MPEAAAGVVFWRAQPASGAPAPHPPGQRRPAARGLTLAVRIHIVAAVIRLLLPPLALVASPVFAALLYDPASGQLPNEYAPGPWSYAQVTDTLSFSTTVVPPVTAAVSGGVLGFDTTGGTVRAGWSRSDTTLDRTVGYTLSFGVQIGSETHVSTDRAGFSVIALSSDLQGIELAFWSDEVWAQHAGFTHGEGTVAFNPAGAMISYALTIQGTGYTLRANDTEVLSGSLRNYSAGGFPYTTPNLVFFGDDTFSASADVDLGSISLAAVPEPAEWSALTGLAALAFAAGRRWRAARR